MSTQGRFITLEGIDGAGKSTHLSFIADLLTRRGVSVRVTREPGGTRLGEKLRELLLDPKQTVHPDTETLLLFAARQEHLHSVIRPALAAGQCVVCDRFTDATFAYQGWGRGIDLTKLETLESWVQGQLQPDLTLYFDVPTEVARERIEATRTRDRFEQEQQAFFERVRNGYLDRAARHPHRIRILDSQRPLTDIQKELESILIRI
jgi:dTMP kinase